MRFTKPMKSRVCILTTVHRPFDVRIFHKEARSLAQAGYEVHLLAPMDGQPGLVDGVHLEPLPPVRGRGQRMTILAWRAFWKALRLRAALYHFHDPELIPIALALKILTYARVVYDIHEDTPRQILVKVWLPPRIRPWIARGVSRLEALAARLFDGLIAATPAIAARFPASKTVVVRNFPRLEELAFSSSARPYAQRAPRALYIGGITTTRGAVEMVEAIARVQAEAELVLAGSFESDALRERLAQRPGWRRTRSLGWLERAEVADLLSKSRIGLVLFHPEPNHIRAQPNKLFEYMAAGIPFVASDFPLWRQIGGGAGLFVDPRDPDAIAQAIQWLLEHPAEAEAMGKRGRARVEKEYNWNCEAEKLLRLYNNLALGGKIC